MRSNAAVGGLVRAVRQADLGCAKPRLESVTEQDGKGREHEL